jgi:flagellar protein FlgJ
MRTHLNAQQQPLQLNTQNAALLKNLQAAQAQGVRQGLASASAKASAGGSSMSHAALVKAANSFEAQLMQELMKPLSAKDPLYSESQNSGEPDDDESGGVLASYGNEALAQALAAGGGLGIGRMVVKQVERQASHNEASTTKVSKKNLVRD